MMIDEMTQDECRELLGRGMIARLGCCLEDQPYVVPVYFAYESDFIYVLSTVGQKIEWMRANPNVCVQVDDVAAQSEWASVIANGQYQELTEPQYSDEVATARKLLEKRHHWWKNALGERQIKSGDNLIAPLFFRIKVNSMSGLRAK